MGDSTTTSAVQNLSIGVVETVKGDVYVLRADGAREVLAKGAPVYEGDQLETGGDSAVAITFVDQSSFSLGDNGSMVLDEMVFDPASGSGAASLSVLEGVFAFVSGQIAKTDPDAMTVKLPVMTIGVRGTKVAGRAAEEGDETVVTLLTEGNGHVGEITITNDAGIQVLNQAHQTIQMTSTFELPPPPVVLPLTEVEGMFSPALDVVPVGTPSGDGGSIEEGATTSDDPVIGDVADGQGAEGTGADDGAVFSDPSQGSQDAETDTSVEIDADPIEMPLVIEVIDSSDKTTASVYADLDISPDVTAEVATMTTLPSQASTVAQANSAHSTTDSESTSTPSTPVNTITGSNGTDVIAGTATNDAIYGYGGVDILIGNNGDDSLFGGDGNDILTGGRGVDQLEGGNGADVFTFLKPNEGTQVSTNGAIGDDLAVDQIVDFASGTDSIAICSVYFGFDAGSATNNVNFIVVNGRYDGTNASGGNYDSKDPTLIFDSTGTLYYDSDGSDAGYTVVAQVQDGATVTADDVNFV